MLNYKKAPKMALPLPSLPILRSQSPVRYMEPREVSVVKPHSAQNTINQKGEHISIKSNNSTSNEKKCQVYVHQFSKIPRSASSNLHNNIWQSGNEIHQTSYKHEKSDYYDAKAHIFRKQFDSLTLNEKPVCYKSPHGSAKSPHNTQLSLGNFPGSNIQSHNWSTKIPVIKSNPNSKINQLMQKPVQHKIALDKLEEQYWAKWKPSKNTTLIKPYVKTKKISPPNNNQEVPFHQFSTTKRSKKDLTDKPVSIESPKVSQEKLVLIQAVTPSPSCSDQIEKKELDEVLGVLPPVPQEDILSEPEISIKTISPDIDVTKETESECAVTNLKHTDSLILTTKKQMQSLSKPHYQQPKCIKLFKNVGCAPMTMSNFIKGGSYPLKSCLKRDGVGRKSPRLGRPGSPIVLGSNNRKSGRNRYSKS